MNNLSKGQFFTTVFTTGAFFVFSSACAQNFSQFVGITLCALFGCVLYLLLSLCITEKKPNKFINLMLFFVMLLAGAGCIASFFNVQRNVDLGINHEILCAVLLSITVIYCASLKLTAAARCSSIVFAFVILTLLLLIIGAFSKLNISNLSLEFNLRAALDYSYENRFISVVFAIAAALFLNDSKKPFAFSGLWAILSIGILSVILSVLSVCVEGTEEPTFFALAKSAQPFSVQSGEWIYIIIYGILSVLCLSVIVKLCSESLVGVFKNIKFPNIICALATFLVAYCMSRFSISIKAVFTLSQIGATIVFFFMLFVRKDKKIRSEKK